MTFPEGSTLVGTVTIAGLVLLMAALCVRLAQGPKFTDRIVAVNSIGNLAICAVAVYGICWQAHHYLDIALTLALLNFFTVSLLSRIIINNRRLPHHDQAAPAAPPTSEEEASHD